MVICLGPILGCFSENSHLIEQPSIQVVLTNEANIESFIHSSLDTIHNNCVQIVCNVASLIAKTSRISYEKES